MYLLVINTAKNCGACKRFKELHYDKLLTALKTKTNLTVLHIDLPTMEVTRYFDNLKNNDYFKIVQGQSVTVSPKIQKYIKWFPQFMLFPLESFKLGNLSSGYIFNGTIDAKNDTAIMGGGGIALNAENILEWITKTIVNNPVNVQPVSINPTVFNNKKTDNNGLPTYLSPSTYKFRMATSDSD